MLGVGGALEILKNHSVPDCKIWREKNQGEGEGVADRIHGQHNKGEKPEARLVVWVCR